jgi:hypothetical protein
MCFNPYKNRREKRLLHPKPEVPSLELKGIPGPECNFVSGSQSSILMFILQVTAHAKHESLNPVISKNPCCWTPQFKKTDGFFFSFLFIFIPAFTRAANFAFSNKLSKVENQSLSS